MIDEAEFGKRYHRNSALEALELAEEEREKGECDWRVINYWQADAQVHAILALSADY